MTGRMSPHGGPAGDRHPPGAEDPKADGRNRVKGRLTSFAFWVRLFLAANLVVVAFLAVTIFRDTTGSLPAGHPAQAAPSTAAPSGELWQMGLAHIPTNAACDLCHEGGGSSGLKPVPSLGHPLEGFRACLTCHANPELARAAPGHQGIPETECLNCHKEQSATVAITQPHSRFQDQECLDCHGQVAHLPTTMVGRDPTKCSACHEPTTSPPPEFEHSVNLNVSCRSCHQSTEVGALPIDHALRGDGTCLLCHDYRVAANPAANPFDTSTSAPTS